MSLMSNYATSLLPIPLWDTYATDINNIINVVILLGNVGLFNMIFLY